MFEDLIGVNVKWRSSISSIRYTTPSSPSERQLWTTSSTSTAGQQASSYSSSSNSSSSSSSSKQE